MSILAVSHLSFSISASVCNIEANIVFFATPTNLHKFFFTKSDHKILGPSHTERTEQIFDIH